jgi:predicted RNA binding protein YcfA (HicA-like mRNA interferase family)
MKKLLKNSREVEKVLDRNDVPHRNGKGSHRVAKLPNGKSLTYPDHGEYGVGLASKITKEIIAAGIILAALIISAPFVVQLFGYQLEVIF